jgi:predicted nucleic acid-binding protein
VSAIVVVDSSAWIEFFRGRELPLLEDALEHGRIAVPPIVVAELVSGAASRGDAARVADLVRDLPLVEADRAHWVRVGELRRRMRAKGLTVSTPDAHVAQCAIDLDAVLLTTEAVFRRLARSSGLRLAV